VNHVNSVNSFKLKSISEQKDEFLTLNLTKH